MDDTRRRFSRTAAALVDRTRECELVFFFLTYTSGGDLDNSIDDFDEVARPLFGLDKDKFNGRGIDVELTLREDDLYRFTITFRDAHIKIKVKVKGLSRDDVVGKVATMLQGGLLFSGYLE